MSLISGLLPVGGVLRLASQILLTRSASATPKVLQQNEPAQSPFGAVLDNLRALGGAAVIRDQDANGDGTLTIEEFSGGATLFYFLDTNDNGRLEVNEVMNPVAAQQRLEQAEAAARSLIEKTDANGDGVVDAGELGLEQDAFSVIDRNGDGLANVQELVHAYAAAGSRLTSGLGA